MKAKLKLLGLKLLSALPRSLPVGVTEFNEWAARIILQVNLPNVPDDHLKFALASQIMHLGSTDSVKADIFFVKALRKVAANQVAGQVFQDIKTKQQEELKAAQQAEATAQESVASSEQKA